MGFKVTIITVVRNASDLLITTMNSVIEQTYNNIEYVVIDGDSDDGTLDVINRYSDKLSYWESEKDLGVYNAMNKSLSFVHGDWVLFLNAGDVFVDNRVVEKVVDDIDVDSELVYGDAFIIGENINRLIKADLNAKIFKETPICHQSLFVRADIMKSVKFNENFVVLSDYYFILDSYLKGRKFQYLNYPISKYLLGGMSSTNILTMYIEGVAILIRISKKVNDVDYKDSSFYKGLVKYILDENKPKSYARLSCAGEMRAYIKRIISKLLCLFRRN